MNIIVPNRRKAFSGGGGGLPSLVDYGSPTAVWQARDLAAGSVTSWADATGNGYDASYVSGTITKSDTGFLSTHGVTTSGSCAMGWTTAINPGAGLVTVIAFGNTASDSQIIGHNSTNSQVRRDRSGANNMSFYGGVERVSAATTGVDHDDPQMMAWVFDGSDCYFQYNKTELFVAGSPGSGKIYNRLFRTSYGAYWNGEVGEIAIHDGVAVSKTVRDQIYDDFKAALYTSLP